MLGIIFLQKNVDLVKKFGKFGNISYLCAVLFRIAQFRVPD